MTILYISQEVELALEI